MNFTYETTRLIMRIVPPAEAQDVLEFYSGDRELFERYEGEHVPQFYTREFQKENLQQEYNMACKQVHVRFYVYLKESPAHIIGTVCFHNIQKILYSSCEVGYKFSRAYHHRGYATEALEKGIDIMFSELGLHRSMAWVGLDNTPSIQLLTSLGFQFEGINRERALLHNQWVDHAQYSLISPLK